MRLCDMNKYFFYLSDALAPLGFDYSDSSAMARNRTRGMLTEFFRDRRCHTLVRPVESEEALQKLSDVKQSELRPQFRRQMAELRRIVFGQKDRQGSYH